MGYFYNLSHPGNLPLIGEKKIVNYSQSDSLLRVLHIQDSLQKVADSLKKISFTREDSLRIVNQKLQDSIKLSELKQDSVKHVADSLKALKKKIEDSLKTVENSKKDTSQVPTKPIDIKIDFAKALFDKGYKFIDARDEPDYNAGHIQGAANIPAKKLEQFKSRFSNYSKDQVIVCYCSAACDASIDLAYALTKDGFKKIYIFHGGWDEWKAAGYPIN